MTGLGIRDWGLVGWALSGAAAVVASLAMRVVPPAVVTKARQRSSPSAVSAPYPADSLARAVVARDLFRVDRRPAGVPYDALRGAVPLPDGPPKPQLTLTGVVWGDIPEAVIEGLPTTDGPRVVRLGDLVGGLAIRHVGRGSVVVVGMDTTWTLAVKEPWK